MTSPAPIERSQRELAQIAVHRDTLNRVEKKMERDQKISDFLHLKFLWRLAGRQK